MNIFKALKTSRVVTALILSSLLALAGCGGGGSSTPAPIQPTTLNAALSGSQEVPAITSAASGTATVTVDAAKTTITVNMVTSGLTNVTASHIHIGAAGANGGVMFSLFAGTGAFPATLTKTLTSADFTAATGVATFAEAVNAILSGSAYINVHTLANGGGEIRGQIGSTPAPIQPTTLNAVLSGTQEVPAVTSAGSGTATVTVNAAKTTINVNMVTSGLTNVTASHIHFGAAGANGGVMFSLFASSAGAFPATLTKTLTSADFTVAPGVATFADAVNAVLSGNAYINVHTLANGGGEIRGQLTP